MSAEQAQSEDLAASLAQMARELVAQPTVQDTLNCIVHHAVSLVGGCQEAGIMVVHHGRVETLAATGPVVRESDRLQAELGEGPCLEAAMNGPRSLRIIDMERDRDGWPRYHRAAGRLGIGSMMAFRLYTDDQDLGALNIYSRRTGALTDRSEQIGWLLASHAAIALAAARTDEQLHTALQSRQRIGQAIGILSERHRIAAQTALDLMSRYSQDNNIRMRDLADHLVSTGDFPE
jgi:transcriptional regulator with GAF, ATPase, and Fis domain